MISKAIKTIVPDFLCQFSLRACMRALSAVLLIHLMPAPAYTTDYVLDQSAVLSTPAPEAAIQEKASPQPAIYPSGRDHSFLAARASSPSSARPAHQVRIGGIGGGFHGTIMPATTFVPETPGQSIQQSIGQTLGQTPKPAPAKSSHKGKDKAPQKKGKANTGTAAAKSPKAQPPSQKKPTVYIIEMNDAQVYRGTMKPTSDGYIVTTNGGTLAIKTKDIRQLKKAAP